MGLCPSAADLGYGVVKGETIQCPFHHWRFGCDGVCAAGSDSAPRLQTYPVEERHGHLFFLNGPEPLFPLPLFLRRRAPRVCRGPAVPLRVRLHLVHECGERIRHAALPLRPRSRAGRSMPGGLSGSVRAAQPLPGRHCGRWQGRPISAPMCREHGGRLTGNLSWSPSIDCKGHDLEFG